jgi:two-component system cell cycle sensor histidine kinase/response regulator CckA
MTRKPAHEPRFPWWLVVLTAIVIAAIVVAGVWLAVDQGRQGRETIENDLLAVGHLKAEQISNWLDERLSDAGMITGAPFVSNLIRDWLTTLSPADEADILAWFDSFRENYGYREVTLVDPDGNVLLSLDDADPPLQPAGRQSLQTAFSEKRAVLTDLHRSEGGGYVHLDGVAPLFTSEAQGGKPLAAVILTIDAEAFLFPLVQSWPTTSETAETLLVERDGDDALFLNELRHQKNTALTLRIPVSQADLPAAMAILGTRGIVEGSDYRGERVIAALEEVPGTQWIMVAKIDTAEAFAGAHVRTELIIAVLTLVVGVVVGAAALLWQRGLKRRYQDAYDSEVLRRTLLARYESLVQQANDIIILTDETGRIVEANERALEAYGYTREELLGLHISQCVPTWAVDQFQAREHELQEKGSFVAEGVHQRKDGSIFPVEISARTVVSEGFRYIQAIIRDVVERHRMEQALRERDEQLQQSQKMEAVGQLAGGIAHDFNNLLTVILGYSAALLALYPEEDSPGRNDIEQIRHAAERAAALTKQILAFSRRQPLRPSVVSINDILESVHPLLQRTLGEDIDIVTVPDPGLGPVEVDVHQFEQVLVNLALNARDAMPNGGRLTLETANVELDEEYCQTHPEVAPGRYVMLAVTDTGVGMDERTSERAFEPFFTTKGPGEGTGLGLSTVYGIVKQSSGSITLYSELGKGTCFKIYLPLTEASAQPDAPAAPDPATYAGDETILLVEDEPALRDLVVRVLVDHGYHLLAAGTAAEALRLLDEAGGVLDILFTDLVLPGEMQGKQLAEAILSSHPDLPVLYMSGYTRNAIVHAGRLDKDVHFLEKPFAPLALVAMVRELLDLDQARRDV